MSNGIYSGMLSGLDNGLLPNYNVGLSDGLEMNYDSTATANLLTPDLLFDFTQIGFYPNSGTSIADLSGKNNNGVFVSGTGNGTPTTVSGMTTGNPSYYNNPSSQVAIRLPDIFKFAGRQPYTIVSWVYPVSTGQGSFPACFYSSEGRSGVAIGVNSAFDFVSATRGFLNYRYDGATGNAQAVSLYPTERGVGLINFNNWYFTAFRYNGTTMNADIFINGTRYNSNAPSPASVLASSSWSAFGGLRYNNWLVGRCAYFSLYLRDIGVPSLINLYSRTRTKIGV